jgi:cell division protease FtsH
MKGLTELAELLLEKEVIFSEDLERIFGKRKADQLKDIRDAENKAATVDSIAIPEELKVDKKKKKSAKTTPLNSEEVADLTSLAIKVKSIKKTDKKAIVKNHWF